MKKSASIFLSLFLLLLSTGVNITWHYCGDELNMVSIIDQDPSCCEGDEPMGCCHNEREVLSLKDDFSTVSYSYELNKLGVDLDVNTAEKPLRCFLNYLTKLRVSVEDDLPPPDIQAEYQVYLI